MIEAIIGVVGVLCGACALVGSGVASMFDVHYAGISK